MTSELEICPNCLKDVCNGMGSAEMPITTAIIDNFPVAGLFEREFQMHDMDHHLQVGFEKSNSRLISRMFARLKLIKFSGWYPVRVAKRNWYRAIIPVIGWFISGEAGREAYTKGACKQLPKKFTGEY
jgi:hypothetical protein